MLFTKIVTLSSLLVCALAAPFPTASTIWHTGRLSRDTSDLPPPANITNKIGQVILGQFDANGEEHLQFGDGSVDVVAPNVPTGKYFLVLFGDSGNNGPTFTIENDSASSKRERDSKLPAQPNTLRTFERPSTLSDSPAPISASSTFLSSGAPTPSNSVTFVFPIRSSPSLCCPQQASSGISWARADSCLTFAAVALSAVLLLA
ncbi:hypothetical protein BC629DRAFT_1507045 [Irpex lacteus]|nr:hypothetical protein BC629DRAFT_1507045 [Irpex lacteus]